MGRPRCLHRRNQDAMTCIRKFGRADLFVTFTYNPKWLEISNELFQNEKARNRHDIIGRGFHEMQKKKKPKKKQTQKLSWLLKVGRIFDELNAWITTIGWQKRRLPPSSHSLI